MEAAHRGSAHESRWTDPYGCNIALPMEQAPEIKYLDKWITDGFIYCRPESFIVLSNTRNCISWYCRVVLGTLDEFSEAITLSANKKRLKTLPIILMGKVD
jgi:predicted Rossmann-fold nucleotide-binding protein